MGVRFDGLTQFLAVANEAFFDRDRNLPFSACCWYYHVQGTGGPVISKASSGSGTGVVFNFTVVLNDVAMGAVAIEGIPIPDPPATPGRRGGRGLVPALWGQ